ncbi:MAG: hypothetical protein GW802_28780 [Armatimonadetes bacterium]|nr:hypothetical protein [Armatimonadota bacterium]
MHPTRRRSAWGMLGIVASAAALHAQPNAAEQKAKAVTASRADGVAIDGALAEAAWQNGPWYTGFITAGRGDKAPVQTRFAVRFDDSFLYFAAVADEPEVAQLKRSETERGGKVFRDDCVEFMIDPTGDRVEYYHFVVNANGALYDAQRRQGGHAYSVEWDSTAEAAGAVGANSFSVELAVPFVELGLTPESAKQAWAIQVARERQAGGALELTSYMKCGGSFHVPDTYAPLTLPGADLSRFLWDVKAPLEELTTSDAGKLTHQFKALLTNGTGRFRFTSVTATLRASEATTSQTLTGGNDDGQQQPYVFRVPFAEPGPHTLTLVIADRQQPDVPLCVRSREVVLQYSPLRLTVTKPSYRNTLYATEQLSAVEATVRLALPEDQLKGARLEGTLFSTAAGQRAPVASAAEKTDTAEARLSIPVKELSVGEYVLAVTATLVNGRTFVTEAPLHRAAPSPNEWRLDENLVLLHNGKPFLPYGWFSASVSDAAKLRDEGVTAIQAYSAQYFPPAKTLEWLDQLQAQGLYGCFYPWPSSAFMDNFTQPVSPEEEQAVRERIRAFRDHPALFAYYLWDEPELRPMLVERADRLYQIIAEEDPDHPCIMLNDTLPGIHKYRNGGDILMPDPYPLFSRGGLAGQPIEYPSKFMRACREASEGKRAWWVTPQAFDYYMGGKANSRCPNLVELRNQQLQSIINGARGFLWYTYSHRYNYKDLDVGMPFLGREAQRLTDAVLAPELPDGVTWEAEAKEHLQAAVRRVDDDLYLFAVNTRTSRQQATFTLKGVADTTLWVVSENRSVRVSGGKFTDAFDLYEGHIYTTNNAVAAGPTVKEAQAAITQAEAARHRPGNLAYRDLGTTVTTSSTNQYSGQLPMVVDGVTNGSGWTDDTWRQWPDWIQATFKEPVSVGRVIVYTDSILEYEIQVEETGQLVKVAEGTRPGGKPIAATWAPRTVTAVRVVAKSGAADRTGVTEIEAYAR